MDKTQIFLIQILSDFINKRKTVLPNEFDRTVLADYGKSHEVLAIIYYQTKLPEFFRAYSSALYFNTARTEMINRLFSEFTFPHFIIKGFEVAKLYPIPLLRTMGDVDLVVHAEDREKAHEIFLSQGYENAGKCFDREWKYCKNDMEFELHDYLLYKESVNNPKQEAFINNFWTYVENNEIDLNFHFLYLIVHLRKHFMIEGVGLRQFMDVAIMAKYADLDWKWIQEKADEIEMLGFLNTVLAFCSRWFEIDVPVALPQLEDSFFETSTIKIFNDGVFGFSNSENQGSDAVNLHWQNGKLGMVGHAMQAFFPSYTTLIYYSDQYDWIKGRKYLLPAAWVYRAFRGLKNYKRVLNYVRKSFASTEQISSREKFYRQWGL